MAAKLTEAEIEQRLELYRQGKTFAEIGKILYFSELSMKNWFAKRGYKDNKPERQARIEKGKRMRQELTTLEAFEQAAGEGTGTAYDRVAIKYGVTRSVAYRHWVELRMMGK